MRTRYQEDGNFGILRCSLLLKTKGNLEKRCCEEEERQKALKRVNKAVNLEPCRLSSI
jgi:hypothetical protein